MERGCEPVLRGGGHRRPFGLSRETEGQDRLDLGDRRSGRRQGLALPAIGTNELADQDRKMRSKALKRWPAM